MVSQQVFNSIDSHAEQLRERSQADVLRVVAGPGETMEEATAKKEKGGLEPLWKTDVNDGDGGSDKGVFACGLCEIA